MEVRPGGNGGYCVNCKIKGCGEELSGSLGRVASNGQRREGSEVTCNVCFRCVRVVHAWVFHDAVISPDGSSLWLPGVTVQSKIVRKKKKKNNSA